MSWQQEQDEVQFSEPVLEKRDCRMEIVAVESTSWTAKEGTGEYAGISYPAMKLTLTITDPDVQTEHEGARPRLTVEHQCNLAQYPYRDKKTGEVKKLGRASLYELEEALGFDPVFTNGDGQVVEPFITRTGRKLAPKGVEGVKRQLNQDFVSAYFTADGGPNLEWAGRAVYADLGLERSDQFGDRNVIRRFKAAPVGV